MSIIRDILEAYVLILVVAALLSWFPEHPGSPLQPVRRVVGDLTDPPLRAIRRILPPLSFGGMGIDLSVIILIILIEIVIVII